MTPLRERPTPDLIIIFLTGIVGVVVIGVMMITAIEVLENPDANVNSQIKFMTTAVASLMTGVIGYIGGRATAGRNGNGKHDDDSKS